MRKLAFGFVPAFLTVFAISAVAQTPPPPQPKKDPPTSQQPAVPTVIPCPQFKVQGPNRPMRDGEQIGFVANVTGGDPKVQPIYSWSISSGVILGGQGTRNISVDSTGSGADRQIVADILVGGYSVECSNQASATVLIAAPANKVDEFGDLPEKDETGKLDSIVNYLGQSPDRVYLIGYAGRNNVRGYAGEVLRRMKAYIAKSGAVYNRVIAIDGGFRDLPAYEIWIVPNGAIPPRPSPTVDRNDIVYPKPPPRTRVKKP